MTPQGDDAIDLHLEMFRFQQKVLQQQMAELQHTMEMAEYKCRYCETAKVRGTTKIPQNMDESEIPKQFRRDSAGASESGGFLTAAKDGMTAR